MCVVWSSFQFGMGYLNVIEIVQFEGCLCVNICVCVRGSMSVWDVSFLALRGTSAQLLML